MKVLKPVLSPVSKFHVQGKVPVAKNECQTEAEMCSSNYCNHDASRTGSSSSGSYSTNRLLSDDDGGNERNTFVENCNEFLRLEWKTHHMNNLRIQRFSEHRRLFSKKVDQLGKRVSFHLFVHVVHRAVRVKIEHNITLLQFANEQLMTFSSVLGD
jgi:hypothetical protein